MSETQQEMPKYACHKQVHALKIKEIVSNPNNSIDIFFEEEGFASVNMEEADHQKKPDAEAGWYFVVYRDGYTSFSPGSEFEDGYNLAVETTEEPEDIPNFLGDLVTGNLVPFDETLAKDPVMMMVANEAEWESQLFEIREAIDAVIQARNLAPVNSQLPDSEMVNAEFFETQDPKYVIIDGALCNAFTKEPIPEDEPVFMLRAKDIHAYSTLDFYVNRCADEQHKKSVEDRMLEFDEFKADNDERMGEPDTLTEDDFAKSPGGQGDNDDEDSDTSS